jgi:predicted RNA-binding protein YlqC (UPF0109 family)
VEKLVKHLVTSLVSNPKKVKIKTSKEEEGAERITLSVAPDDMGVIIGKKGKTINAIRSLVKTAATKEGRKVFLELEEKKESQ